MPQTPGMSQLLNSTPQHEVLTPCRFQEFLGADFPKGKLVDLKNIWSIHDFEDAARIYLNRTAYTWIRTGVGGEYSYRNNLDVYSKIGFKPRMLTGPASGISPLNTTLGSVEIQSICSDTDNKGHRYSATTSLLPFSSVQPLHQEQLEAMFLNTKSLGFSRGPILAEFCTFLPCMLRCRLVTLRKRELVQTKSTFNRQVDPVC